jgi:hypothetical protein
MKWIQTMRVDATSAEVWRHATLADGKAIYRYMRPFRLFQLLDERALTLASPDRWVDPFEQWWADQLFRANTKLSDVVAFGSCWTTKWGHEPFWRLHGCTCPCDPSDRPAPAVRIKSRVGALLRALQAEALRVPTKAFLGMVDYSKGHRALLAEAERVQKEEKAIAKVAATALHRKRPAFSYEEEVRLLLVERGAKPGLRKVALEPAEVIEQIMIGPVTKRDVHYVEWIESELIKRGVSAVERSPLYDGP